MAEKEVMVTSGGTHRWGGRRKLREIGASRSARGGREGGAGGGGLRPEVEVLGRRWEGVEEDGAAREAGGEEDGATREAGEEVVWRREEEVAGRTGAVEEVDGVGRGGEVEVDGEI